MLYSLHAGAWGNEQPELEATNHRGSEQTVARVSRLVCFSGGLRPAKGILRGFLLWRSTPVGCEQPWRPGCHPRKKMRARRLKSNQKEARCKEQSAVAFVKASGIRLESAINPVLAVSWLELEVFSRNHQGFKSTNHQFKSLRGKLVLLQGFIQAFVRMKIAT